MRLSLWCHHQVLGSVTKSRRVQKLYTISREILHICTVRSRELLCNWCLPSNYWWYHNVSCSSCDCLALCHLVFLLTVHPPLKKSHFGVNCDDETVWTGHYAANRSSRVSTYTCILLHRQQSPDGSHWLCSFTGGAQLQEAKYVESWPNTTSAWADWSRFDIPVDGYDGVHFPATLHQQYTRVSYLPLN